MAYGRRAGPRSLAVTLVLAVLVLVGCGGSEEDAALPTVEGGSGQDAGEEAAEVATEVNDEEAALAFAQCMRAEGVEDFPDPEFGADGSVEFGGGPGEGGGAAFDDPAVEAAFEACQVELEGAGFAPDDGDLAELEDQLVAFADCLRDQGLDVDDPQLGGGGPGAGGPGEGGPFGGIDPDDPDQQAALEACQDQVNLQPPGAGGDAEGGN